MQKLIFRIIFSAAMYACLVAHVSAQSINKIAEFKRGEVSELDVAGINYGFSNLYVVGVINSRKNLMIFVFSGIDTAPRSITELGKASSVSISPAGNSGSNRFVTAMRDSVGKLRVIGWQVSDDGRTLSRLGTNTGPRIKAVTISNSGFGDFRIAAQLDNNELYVALGSLGENGAVRFSSGVTYGRVKDVALAGGTYGAMALRISDDTFRISPLANGGASGVQRGSTLLGGEVTDLDITGVDVGTSGRWVSITSSAYVNTSNIPPNYCLLSPRVVPYYPIGRGKLIAWEQDSITGGNLSRIGEYEFSGIQGLAHEVSIIPYEPSLGKRFITAHLGYSKPCDMKPRMELHLWEFDEGFTKLASSKLGGDYLNVDMTLIRGVGGKSRFVAAVQGRTNNLLKITVWEASAF